ncbi:FHIPEP family type III secretion protein [Piscinibacter sp.]|uniref:FHIPEP family type III secretion protein n=1 Tax=Piscinibacter sp. TaxID=1903157 RepID=UPI002BFF2B3D|nr:FHIPEP family type III secretion protein [Albitalea sp.]HUG22596.1 FHIPEP family type III secretion protein [Albitalea sp.]
MTDSASLRPAPLAPVRRASYSDLLLVACVCAILAMMVLTLSPLVIDVMVALNIAVGVVVLLVALYIGSPLEFSVFPSLLLITTLFRLSVSIATTKLILLHGNAGHIVDTFGTMVAGGNLVVGLVVFLIITVVQFIVIAKGAERVAEVAARFSLDAMPGKQLSIDSDLRSGLIDKDEARRKRRQLEQESKLHGSLDGAMKFVKGDAIAGIVIIVINLLGGLAIGVMQQGMDLGAAMIKYSILTIGDGMVAQIPALLAAMSAGLIVTRATDDESDRHLGEAIVRQVSAKPRVLLVAGGLCVLLALVPGFPWAVFLLLGAVLSASGALLMPVVKARWQRFSRPARETVLRRKDTPPAVLATALPPPRPTVPLLLELPAAALQGETANELVSELEGMLDRINLTLGLPLPRVNVHALARSAGDGWRLLAFEVPIAHGTVPPADLPRALAEATWQALRRHAALFFGTQEASALLTRASNDMPDVVKEVLRALPLQRVAEILRRLVDEEVAIRNTRDILEALADAAQREKDVYALTELARIALKRQLSHRVAPHGMLRAVLLAPELEEMLRQAVRVSNGVQQLALDPQQAGAVMDGLAAAVNAHAPAAVVTAVDIRRHVRKLIETECFDTPVLSFHELVPTLRLDVAARVGVPNAPLLEAA